MYTHAVRNSIDVSVCSVKRKARIAVVAEDDDEKKKEENCTHTHTHTHTHNKVKWWACASQRIMAIHKRQP